MESENKLRRTVLVELGIALMVLVPLIIGVFLLRFYIRQSVSQITEIRQDINQRTQTLLNLANLQNEYTNYGQSYLTILHNVVPEKDRLINISQEFQVLARSENLGFGFSFLNEQLPAPPELGFIDFRLNLVADNIDQISRFLQKLEKFRFITTVSKVDITRKENEITSLVEGRVYFR